MTSDQKMHLQMQQVLDKRYGYNGFTETQNQLLEHLEKFGVSASDQAALFKLMEQQYQILLPLVYDYMNRNK